MSEHKMYTESELAEEKRMVRLEAAISARDRYESALDEASIFCLGCAKKETVVIPPRSDVVGLAAVHSSGMICIPNTVRALMDEAYKRWKAELRAEKGAADGTKKL